MARFDGRAYDELRKIVISRHYIKHAPGSVLVEMGETKVLCTATYDDRPPHHMKGSGKGWISAEYSMLPRSTPERNQRERSKVGGRTQEIQRLIGRSMRSVAELEKLGECTIWLDCDVIQADGGTRTASITGAYVALVDLLNSMPQFEGKFPVSDFLAAVSVGIVDGECVLDLCYAEDFRAQVDMNVVMTASGKIVEVQGTAEGFPFDRAELDMLLDLGTSGVKRICEAQRAALGDVAERIRQL